MEHNEFEQMMEDLDKKPKSRRMGKFWHEVGTLGRMARAVKNGEYSLTTPQVAMIVGTLTYVVSPIDAIPDPILPFGLADDAALVAGTVAALAVEIASFRDWELSQVA